MKKKGKTKTKKKAASRRTAKKKASPKKVRRKGQKKKELKSLAGIAAVRAVATVADDPIGACYWVDASGQTHCKITTQSACKGAGMTFRANKQCPGGEG